MHNKIGGAKKRFKLGGSQCTNNNINRRSKEIPMRRRTRWPQKKQNSIKINKQTYTNDEGFINKKENILKKERSKKTPRAWRSKKS